MSAWKALGALVALLAAVVYLLLLVVFALLYGLALAAAGVFRPRLRGRIPTAATVVDRLPRQRAG